MSPASGDFASATTRSQSCVIKFPGQHKEQFLIQPRPRRRYAAMSIYVDLMQVLDDGVGDCCGLFGIDTW